MKLLAVTNKNQAVSLRKYPLVAVDMGLSGTTKSCGVAFAVPEEALTADCYYFGTAAETVSHIFRRYPKAVLILEAPLSAAFDKADNPTARGQFEREGKPRWWNLGAGSQMALAALYFCRMLEKSMPLKSSVHLVEGFVVGDESREHAIVAGRLADAFRGRVPAQWYEVAAEGELVSIAEWFGEPRGCACPVVLQPRAV